MLGWADVGLWVAVCFLAKISFHRPTWKTTFARLTQSQAISQSFRVSSLQINERYDFFSFFKTHFLYKIPLLLPWWSKDVLVVQVAGGQLRNPPVKFRHERWLHLAIDQHPACPNRGRLELWPRKWFLFVTLSMLIDLLTNRCRSTQVKLYTGLIASIDLWPQEMFTFSEMLALVQSEGSFGAFVFHRRPAGLQATSDLVGVCVSSRSLWGGLSRCRLVGSCVLPGEDFFT